MQLEENSDNFAIFKQIAEQSNQVYFIYELNQTCFRYINASFDGVWGRCRNSIYRDGSAIVETLHQEDKEFILDQYRLLLENGQRKSVEFRITLPDGHIRWICLTAYLVQKEATPFFVAGYCEDITSSKAYTYNLLKYNAKKNSILEILSHDLAAPFATIQGMAGLLERKLKDLPDSTVIELLAFIKDSSKRGTDLIRDFVAQEFLESSQVVLTKHRVDMVEKIRTVIENYKLGGNLIAKKFKIASKSKCLYMEVDEMKFMQVINNLISNAIKFTPDDGTITVSIEDKHTTTLITVADDGIGIPKKLQKELFDKFTKARREGLRGEKSTGLGMSIIKTIVELHQGSIWFESEENKGATFYIEIPKEG